MQKSKFLLLLCLVMAGSFSARSQTWADNVATILFNNCVSCHRPSGIAPFSLLTYTDAYNYRLSIKADVSSRHMPPWPPADTYVHFAGARVLSSGDINTIVNWVNNNSPSGNLANAPPAPPPPSNQLGVPDKSLRMPDFISTASGSDVYQCFVLPLRLPAAQFLSAIEVIPGDPGIVHHVLVFQDTTPNHAAQQLDIATPEPGYTNFGGIGVNSAVMMYGWVPGTTTKKLPIIFGQKIYPNSDLVIQVHYPAGTSGRLDSTKVRLYYNTNIAAREVRVDPILNHFAPTLVNGPLSIPANTVKTFEEKFTLPVLYTASVLSVAPHMHLVGTTLKSFANKPNGDTIRFIDIPKWDFHWQGQYYFQRPVIVSAGSTLRAFATYDNTTNNPSNPNSPPRTVNLGESTTDEMMLVYFAHTAYQTGDENIILDSSLIVTGINDPRVFGADLSFFPNPTNTSLQFRNPHPRDPGRLSVWNMGGQKVMEKTISSQEWVTISTNELAAGAYLLFYESRQKYYKGKFIVTQK